MQDASLAALRQRILHATLPHVVFDGWTSAALRAGLAADGLKEIDAVRAFPGGIAEVAEAYLADADERMLEALSREPLASMRVTDRIIRGLEIRLAQHQDDRELLARTLAHYALPMHSLAGMRALYRTVDAIWRAAGDTATDFNFYSKRALLAWVYMTTLTAFLADGDLTKAGEFLRRRIDEVLAAGKRWRGLKAKFS